MTVNVKQRVTAPTMYVTKDRQRVKQHSNFVYLNNGDEFEIELFNPTTKKVLAKISLNDISLGSGIVLRPGERVFLERYLDEAKKFIFETYNVDKSDPNVQRAIQNNGKVEVEFFDEYTPPYWVYDPTITITNNPGIFYYNNSGDVTFRGDDFCTFTSNNIEYGGNESINIGCSYDFNADNISCYASTEAPKSLDLQETGRIEKGAHSNQSFDYDNTSFNTFASWKRTWKILPLSQKVYTREEISVYCTGCGAKRKKSAHKFCPHCGSKY